MGRHVQSHRSSTMGEPLTQPSNNARADRRPRRPVIAEVFALVCLVAACCGCGDAPAGPETVAVTGIVSLDGAPVAGADVAFLPMSAGGDAAPAQAITNDSGEFEVVSVFEQGRVSKNGMLPGEYQVEVRRLESPVATLGSMQPPKNTLPPRYASAKSSGLNVVISPNEANHFPLQLIGN